MDKDLLLAIDSYYTINVSAINVWNFKLFVIFLFSQVVWRSLWKKTLHTLID